MSESIFILPDISDITCQWLKTPNWTTNLKLLCSLQILLELVGGMVRYLLVNSYASLGKQLWDLQPMFLQFSMSVQCRLFAYRILHHIRVMEVQMHRFKSSSDYLRETRPNHHFFSYMDQPVWVCVLHCTVILKHCSRGQTNCKYRNNLFYLFSWLLLYEMWKAKSLMSTHHYRC